MLTLGKDYTRLNPKGHALGQLVQLILKSKETLLTISVCNTWNTSNVFVDRLLLNSPNLVEFRVEDYGRSHSGTRLLSPKRFKSEPLQLLWIPQLAYIPVNSSTFLTEARPALFKNLTSLRVSQKLDHSQWRETLSHSAQSLKDPSIQLSSQKNDDYNHSIYIQI